MKKILCYGDSNTYGYDPRDGGRYDAGIRWVDLLSNDGYVTVNEGLNGREIPTGVAEYGHLNSIIKRQGDIDILVLALGVNDAYNMRNPNAKDICGRWRDVFKNIPALNELRDRSVPIVLVSPPIGPTDVWGNEKAQEISEALEDLADEYRAFAEQEGLIFADANTFGVELAFDGVHFTEKGSITFYENLSKIIKCL